MESIIEQIKVKFIYNLIINMKPTVTILITGQKIRLELLSKINKIIKPNINKYNFNIVLSISDTNNFTNKHKYDESFKGNFCDIKKDLMNTQYYINHIKYPDLKINNDILSMYDKKIAGKEFLLKRANNHARQYYTLWCSYEKIKNLNPDILIRIRDDAILSKPLILDQIFSEKKILSNINQINGIITPLENRHGGINDKFAIVFKKSIQAYLKKPFETYNVFNSSNNSSKFENPEQFLKMVYIENNFFLATSNINLKILGTKV